MNMNITQLKNELASGTLRGVYLLHGDEPYLIKMYADKIKNMAATEMQDLNADTFDDKSTLPAFIAATNNPPLLCEKRAIIANNTDFIKTAANAKRIIELLKNPPPIAAIVFTEPSLSKVYKEAADAIAKSGAVVECPVQPQSVLISWLARIFQNEGVSISKDNAAYLIELCAASMQRLEQEASKLAAYCESGNVTREAIDLLVEKPTDYKIFKLSEHMLKQEADICMQMLKEFAIKKEPVNLINVALYNTLSEILMFKEVRTAASFLPQNKQFLASRLQAQAKKLDGEKLRAAMRLCARFDIDTKTKDGDPHILLSVLVLSIIRILN